MKDYFSFNLTGKKLLPIWILFLVFYFVPYAVIMFSTRNHQPGDKPALFIIPLIILMTIIALLLTFYLVKLTIESITYKDKTIVFNGAFWQYAGTVLLGLFLTIITIGIYGPWFIRDIQRFFIDNSSYDTEGMKFKGKAGKLFLILTLILVVPSIVFSIIMVMYATHNNNTEPAIPIVFQLIMMVLMIPYLYFVYKWMVDITFKGYHIFWDTNFWSSCGRIAAEMFLSIITVGIYLPLATVRLYEYFTGKTVAVSADNKLRFGYNIDQLNDFLYIWGQTLLIIITLGIYYPWAFCKIGKRILGKTYVEQDFIPEQHSQDNNLSAHFIP